MSEKELIKSAAQGAVIKNVADMLSKRPPKSAIRDHNGNKYIPISFIEQTLDMIFGAMGWQTRNFTTQTLLNEVVGSIELWVRDPESGEWIVRIGAASQPIQMKKDTDFTDPRNKIANSLEKGYPSLKSKCVSNAADSLGKVLGRDLGRKQETVETYSSSQEEKARTAFLGLLMDSDADVVKVELAYNILPFDVRADKTIIEAKAQFIEQAKKQLSPAETQQTLF